MTVAEATAQILMSFEDQPSPEIVLTALNAIHRDLCLEYAIEHQDWSLNLVKDQREYPISDQLVMVRQAVYYDTGADLGRFLRPRFVDELDALGSWRHETGTPHSFYIDNVFLGLYPAPSRTTSGGVPRVVIHAASCTPLTRDRSLPGGVATQDAYIWGARMELVAAGRLAYNPERALAVFGAMYKAKKDAIERYGVKRNRHARVVPTPVEQFGDSVI